MIFKDEECFILTIEDISVHSQLEETKRNNKVLNLLTNSVSRELLTPISCVVELGQNIKQDEDMSLPEMREKVSVMLNAGKLLDIQVKSLLDKSLTENDL